MKWDRTCFSYYNNSKVILENPWWLFCMCLGLSGQTPQGYVSFLFLSGGKDICVSFSQNWLLCLQSKIPSIDYLPSPNSAYRFVSCNKIERGHVRCTAHTRSTWVCGWLCLQHVANLAPSFHHSLSHSSILLWGILFFFLQIFIFFIYLKIQRVWVLYKSS
jgi:hypothetical protein